MSTEQQITLNLNDREYEVLERFREAGYKGFVVVGERVLGTDAHEGGVYATGGVGFPSPPDVIAALLNGLLAGDRDVWP